MAKIEATKMGAETLRKLASDLKIAIIICKYVAIH